MAKLIFGMNLSLDGFVDHEKFAPDDVLFRHWIDHVQGLSGSIYGRRMYDIMRYWDDDQPDWGPAERDFALAWRALPKWVVSHQQIAVGPNARPISRDVEAAVRALKQDLSGEITVSGPVLASSLFGLVDEFRLYYHPVVLGRGAPFFAASPPPLRLVATDAIGNVVRLNYVPA